MTIQQIRSELTIQRVLQHYNLKPDRNDMLCCPFHDDKKASLKIYPKTNTAYCFAGGCSVESVDVIDFILNMEKSSKHEAIKKAKSLCNPQTKVMTVEEEFTTYRKSLQTHKVSQEYCESRKLDWRVLEIGYKSRRATDRWGRGCIIFALKDKTGNIIDLYGRAQTSVSHYYRSGRRGLYPSYPSLQTEVLILCESIIDAATLVQLDLQDYSILALYGTNGLTAEHLAAISDLKNLKEIIFALDGDTAGWQAEKDYSEKLNQLYPKLKQSSLNLPQGEDVNSLAVSHEDYEGLFNQLLESRKSLKEVTRPTMLNTQNPELLIYQTELIQTTILGGIQLEGLDRLRVTLKMSYQEKSLRHNLDLYNGDQLDRFLKKAVNRLDLSGLEVEELMNDLIEELETYRLSHIDNRPTAKEEKQLTPLESQAARDYLSTANLMQRTMDDLGETGIVGEQLNRLLMYVVMTSRKRSHPLHVMSLAPSGQGKTHLQERVSACIPEEDKLEITSLSDNALYYFGKDELKHKLLLIEDLDGAEGVLYPLRELQSKRRINKTVTLKDRKGQLKTKSLEVNGPVSVGGCTTREGLYEDNANRSFLLYLDSSKEQDARIMNYQKSLSAGKVNEQKENQKRSQLQNTQRLLKNIKVRNPYAEQLHIPEVILKPRRTNSHYLAFIEAITFYHQYQREVKQDKESQERYIETSKEDIRWANKLLAPVLLRKSDELTGACRSFFEELKTYLQEKEKKSFYSKEIRKNLRLSYSTLKRHLIHLTRSGYVKIVSGSRSKGFEYEVISYEEYEELKANIQTVLDKLLD